MEKCFVIQPFDDGKFDKRYQDVFGPAIKAADLEPYRVDRDPSVSVPIEDIESGIRSSRACLADITTNNPNVWFELGYAIASQREVVLICADERDSPFPFDVQHRRIIKYSTDSPSDFDHLRGDITNRLKALLKKQAQLGEVARISTTAPVEGLEQIEIATLVAVAEQLDEPTGGTTAHLARQNMENAGFTGIAATIGLRELLSKKMLEKFEDEDFNGRPFIAYKVTNAGMEWLFQNQAKLKCEPPITDADIPF